MMVISGQRDEEEEEEREDKEEEEEETKAEDRHEEKKKARKITQHAEIFLDVTQEVWGEHGELNIFLQGELVSNTSNRQHGRRLGVLNPHTQTILWFSSNCSSSSLFKLLFFELVQTALLQVSSNCSSSS